MSKLICMPCGDEYLADNPQRFKIGDFVAIANAPEGREHLIGTTAEVLDAGPWFLPQLNEFIDYRVRMHDGTLTGLYDFNLAPLAKETLS